MAPGLGLETGARSLGLELDEAGDGSLVAQALSNTAVTGSRSRHLACLLNLKIKSIAKWLLTTTLRNN